MDNLSNSTVYMYIYVYTSIYVTPHTHHYQGVHYI